MELTQYRLRLNRNRDAEDTPPYSLLYKNRSERACDVSHAILSALIGDHDVIIEVSSDLVSGTKSSGQGLVARFAEEVSAYPVTCRQREVPSGRKMALMGFSIDRSKKDKSREAAVYVPNAAWRQEGFAGVLPLYGVRYYVLREPMADMAAERVWTAIEEVKAELFSLILFDVASIGQIGVTPYGVGEEDLKRMLGL